MVYSGVKYSQFVLTQSYRIKHTFAVGDIECASTLVFLWHRLRKCSCIQDNPLKLYVKCIENDKNNTVLLSLRIHNKANLRDLIAATGLGFLLKLGFKSLIFGPI